MAAGQNGLGNGAGKGAGNGKGQGVGKGNRPKDGKPGKDKPVNPCLLPGTLIATPQGMRPIEDLQVGDEVFVLGGGAEPILHISRRDYEAAEVAARPELNPMVVQLLIPADGDEPRTLMLSRHHRVVMPLSGAADAPAVLISALHLSRCRPDLCCEKHWSGPIAWLNIYTANHSVIVAGGLAVETGWLGGKMASRLLGEAWEGLAHLAPQHSAKPALPMVTTLESLAAV